MARATTDIQSWAPVLRRPRPRAAASLVALGVVLATAVGCSGRGTYITGGPSAGQMKASLSHLEYENDQLKTQVARLKEENRAFEDRLVQEQLHNGELAAKLDDARNALRDGGSFDMDADAPAARARTLPAGNSSPTRRRAPSAQISRASDASDIPPIVIEDDAPRGRGPSSSSSSSSKTRPQSTRRRDDDDLTIRDSDLRWTPIAQGGDSPKR